MAYYLGSLVGAIIATLLGRTVAWWLFGKFAKMPDEVPRAVGAAVLGYALMIALAGWGNANGGPWNPGSSWIFYAIGIAMWFIADLWRIVQARKRSR
jgi:hypothetical protein